MKKKKLLKRILIFILLIVVLLVALPFLLKDTLIKKYVAKVNSEYNINIAYNNVNFSLLKHFPSATVTITDLNITTEEPFKNDTLVYAKKVFLDINVKDIFKKDLEKIKVKELTFNQTNLNLLVSENGIANYTVSKNEIISSTKNEEIVESKPFTFKIAKYNLTNSTIVFNDKQSNTYLKLEEINHTGSGNFSALKTDLNTKTNVDALTLKLGKVTYFNKTKIDLNAVLGLDFEQNKFTFKENKAKINDLALSFNGFVQLNPKDILTDISFNAPKANFKSVLSLIPSAYSSNFNGVTASGIATISGFVNGKSSDTETPKYAIKIKTENAQFKYPDLPKRVTDITFNGKIANNSSKNNAFLNINKLKFTIDKDTFESHGTITNLTTNPTFDTAFKGTLDLENLTQAYPIKLDNKLTGVLQADFTTKADINAIDTNKFDRIKTNGTASLHDFSYNGKDVANAVYIKNANIKFKTNTISLTDFNAKTGKSDLKASGTLDNLYAFVFNDNEKLKGNFKVTSNNFVVSDFLVDESKNVSTKKTASDTKITESLKIPEFLDIATLVNANTVVYDDLILNNVNGTMQLKDQQAILKQVKAKMLQGDVAFNGIVDTKKTPANFDLDMLVNDFDIAKSFNQLETFQKLIPIAKALQGKFDTSFKIKGNLNNDFSPNMNSLDGSAMAQLFVNNITENGNPLFQALTSNLSFIDFKKLNLENLKTALSFKNGKVSVNPFAIKYKDITMHISGNHGFDKTMLYNLKMDLPAKYLGKEAVNLLAQLTDIDKDTIKVPLNALINGSVFKPIIKANIKQAMSTLALKVVKYQKDKLINQATGQVTDVIKDAIGENDILNGILQGSGILSPKEDITKDSISIKPETTTTKPKDVVEDVVDDAVNGLINGIFGKKKKKK